MNSRLLSVRALNCILVFLLLQSSISAYAGTVQGEVVHIADGDTLTILTNANEQVKIRLAGIDTPEKAQPLGNKAKHVLAGLTFQKQASQTLNFR